MSEYEWQDYEPEVPSAGVAETAWQAAYEVDPAATAWAMAQQAAHQHQAQLDEQRIAEQAASAAAEALLVAQQQQAQSQAVNSTASSVDRSMAAEYGRKWVDHANEVAVRLSADPEYLRSNPFDARTVLDHTDRVFRQVVKENDTDAREWSKIRSAATPPYWQSAEYRQALNDVRGDG